MSTITIYASCHCKTFNTSFDIPSSAFPLKSSICHCNLCRHCSGHAFGSFAVIPLPYTQTPSTEGLVGYKSSERLTRWFCRTCGAKCWDDDRTAGDKQEEWEWEICIGLVDKVEVDGHVRAEIMAGLLNRVQMWVEDTVDGGASIWVNGGMLQGMDRRLVGRQSEVVSNESVQAFRKIGSQLEDGSEERKEIFAACNCRSVELLITRKGDERYQAGLDACESCRKVTGSEITAWATVPMKHVVFPDGRELDLQSNCFRRYATSESVLRVFCNDCGATIFYKSQRDTIDIAVGLFRSKGVRAEHWLEWHKYGDDYVAYREDTVDKGFIDGLVAGLERSGEA